MLFLEDVLHPLLDRLEVLVRQGARQIKIVIETVLDRWTDGDLPLGKHLEDGLGHDVGQSVTDSIEPFLFAKLLFF